MEGSWSGMGNWFKVASMEIKVYRMKLEEQEK